MVVVACNGVGTPRLLLMSDNLANSSDQVGRNLMHHTLVVGEIWVEEPLHSHMGFIGALISMEFAETDTSARLRQRLQLQLRDHRPRRRAGDRLPHAGLGALGQGAPRLVPPPLRPWLCACSRSATTCRRPSNRVTLSDSEKDADGLPAPKISYAPHENDLRMMRFALRRLEDIAQAADAFDYRLHDYMSKDGVYQTPAWHLLGTCRMGADPETSVINRWHQAWDVPNLYIVDGSALTTSGVVNPTNTICALALRAAEHLRDNFAERRRATRPEAS